MATIFRHGFVRAHESTGPDNSSHNWDLYATRHVVYKPTKLAPETLEVGYWRAYREFYHWSNIFRCAWTKANWGDRMRHLTYAGAWKKLEPAWDLVIRAKQVTQLLPALENVLTSFGSHPVSQPVRHEPGKMFTSQSNQSSVG